MIFRDWWAAKSRAAAARNARLAADAGQRGVSRVRGLRGLTDDELIAQSPVRNSLSYPHHEMEMQRRLKDSIVALTAETAKARWWAFWGSLVIGVLTLVLVALTIVLAMKG